MEKQLRLFVYLLFILVGCRKDEENSSCEIVGFQIEAKKNAHVLKKTIDLQINGNSIEGTVPLGTDLTYIIATFSSTGQTVRVNNVIQQSGVTINDFTQPLDYVVEAEDGSVRTYKVIVSFTGLPVVYIDTENKAAITSKDDYTNAQLKLDGGPWGNFNSAIEIRGRGNTTWMMPKKPYKIKLKEKASLLGMPADKEWALLANFSDKSLMRNAVAFELSRRFGLGYTPRSQFVEVFMNGEYLGNYLLTEHVKVAKDRVNIKELKAGDKAENVITGGYFLEVDIRLDEDFWFHTLRGVPVTVKSPEDITPPQFNYIKNYFQEAENAIYSIADAEASKNYEDYIDVESFINWFLVNELLKNNDAVFHSSVYMYKDRGGKLSLGPVWDFDIALGNINYNGTENPEGWWVRNSPWISQLFEDPAFKNKVKSRWNTLKQKEVNSIFTYINSTAVQLKYSQKENFEKWNILDNYTWPNNVVMGSDENEVQYLKDWLLKRINWMDTEINALQ